MRESWRGRRGGRGNVGMEEGGRVGGEGKLEGKRKSR